MTPPRASSALPPRALPEAVPKGISGRASYLQVCLVFRSYPQVITTFFNRLLFGPPQGFTPASSCPWIDHLGFGSAPRDLHALFRLAFAPAPRLRTLSLAAQDNSQAHSTKGTPPPLEGRGILPVHGFRFYFTPLAGVLFTFPSRYLFAIGSRVYSALDRGRPGFGQGSTCPALLREPAGGTAASDTRLSRCPAPLPSGFSCAVLYDSLCSPATPLARFGLLPFRSPLLRESLLISFPALLRWFTSRSTAPAGCLLRPSGCMPCGMRVTPFGNPRINGYVLLRAAYRGLSRPSSPLGSTGIRHGPISTWPCPSSRASQARSEGPCPRPSLLPFSLAFQRLPPRLPAQPCIGTG